MLGARRPGLSVPLVVVDLVAGRSTEQVGALLDAVHAAVVQALEVPERDRYQVVHEHEASRLVVQDTGLGIERSADVVVIQVTSRPRPREQKVAFYRLVCEQFGVTKGSILMRKYACCYAQGRPGCREFRTRVSRVATPAEFHAVVEQYFPRIDTSPSGTE